MPAERGYTARRAAGFLLLAAWVFGIFACSPRQLAVRELSAVMAEGARIFDSDDDLDLIGAAIPANIKLLETFRNEAPDDQRIGLLLARLYGSYAFAFAERDLEAETLIPGSRPAPVRAETPAESIRRYYRKGAEYALDVLEERRPGCSAQLDSLSDAERCFSRCDRSDLPALFWYGFDLGGYVNQSRGSIKALSRAHLAERAMKRVLEIEPSFYHGGAHLFLMIYYSARPPMAGGNPEAAGEHYRALQEMHGGAFLLADLFRARYLLYQAQDREAFHRVLTDILERPISPAPYRLLNKVAKERAALYLAAEDRLFP